MRTVGSNRLVCDNNHIDGKVLRGCDYLVQGELELLVVGKASYVYPV